MADAYATIANGGRPHPADRDHQGRVRRRQRRQPRRPAAQARVHRRRGVRRHAGAEDGDPERNRHRRRLRLPGGRQDRHDEQLHRRLVRRLHPAAGDRGLGRLPELDDVDVRRQRARARVRRHARGADLARLHVGGEQRLLRRLPDPDDPVPRHRVLRQVRDDREPDARPRAAARHSSTSTTHDSTTATGPAAAATADAHARPARRTMRRPATAAAAAARTALGPRHRRSRRDRASGTEHAASVRRS